MTRYEQWLPAILAEFRERRRLARLLVSGNVFEAALAQFALDALDGKN